MRRPAHHGDAAPPLCVPFAVFSLNPLAIRSLSTHRRLFKLSREAAYAALAGILIADGWVGIRRRWALAVRQFNIRKREGAAATCLHVCLLQVC